jgi:TrkA domain protein
MERINETRLPGLGIRHDFECDTGDRVGVISHHGGRRELVIYRTDDPDRVAHSVVLDADEAHSLADILGGTSVTHSFDDLRQNIAGLAIDWLPVVEGSPAAGQAIGATQLRTRTGVSIVALMRGDRPIPAPEPDEVLQVGDTAVVVGTDDGINAAAHLLSDRSSPGPTT